MSRLTPLLTSPRVVGLALVLAWLCASVGLVSSNDGSHLALARALLRGQTFIDKDVALTLKVDLAQRGEHYYSDRPPGTALLSLPAVWLGGKLNRTLARHALGRREVLVRPATSRYDSTYKHRSPGAMPLMAFQGTRLGLALHTALVGGLGLFCVLALCRRRGVGAPGQSFAALGLGAATLWGPYSTMLFAHVTAGALLAAAALCAELAGEQRGALKQAALALAAGTCAAWAAAAEYTLVLVVPLLLALTLPRRPGAWALALVGAAPVVAVTLAYHQAAFGAPLALGYDFQTNFGFARQRAATFSGDPLVGLWTLWGGGRGGGLLALSPVLLVGLIFSVRERAARRWLIALMPWVVLLLFHRTPWGGAGEDHRYLAPALPLLAVGLGMAWQHLQVARRWGLLYLLAGLAAFSGAHVWVHFFAWRGLSLLW